MKRTLIVDGDIVLFQIGRVTEDISDFGDEVLESYDLELATSSAKTNPSSTISGPANTPTSLFLHRCCPFRCGKNL